MKERREERKKNERKTKRMIDSKRKMFAYLTCILSSEFIKDAINYSIIKPDILPAEDSFKKNPVERRSKERKMQERPKEICRKNCHTITL